MPELPEVEIIRRGLESSLKDLTIEQVTLVTPKSFEGDQFLVVGQRITRVWRRAKVLGIDLAHNQTLLVHLKMSGQLIFKGAEQFIGGHPTQDMFGDMPNRSTRVIFELTNQSGITSQLYFNDQRRFGWIKVVQSTEVKDHRFLKSLGPEPLGADFTWEQLKENLLRHKNTPIKVALLDQTVVAGVGNIYASEACFLAKVDPRRKVVSLSDPEFKKVHQGVLTALQSGIQHGGSSKTHFVNADGRKGLFLDYAFVYSREGEPCRVCGTELKKIKLGGRGTVFCPKCQDAA